MSLRYSPATFQRSLKEITREEVAMQLFKLLLLPLLVAFVLLSVAEAYNSNFGMLDIFVACLTCSLTFQPSASTTATRAATVRIGTMRDLATECAQVDAVGISGIHGLVIVFTMKLCADLINTRRENMKNTTKA